MWRANREGDGAFYERTVRDDALLVSCYGVATKAEIVPGITKNENPYIRTDLSDQRPGRAAVGRLCQPRRGRPSRGERSERRVPSLGCRSGYGARPRRWPASQPTPGRGTAGNLAAVARQLGRTQPAVSQHVRALEREFGQRLFHRQARGVVPTRAGRVLHHGVIEALGTIARAERRMREAEANDPGPVRVVTGGTTVRHFLKDALMRFQMAHPHVELRFRTAHSTARCMELLVRDEADLAFVTAGTHAHHVDQVVLIEMPRYLICRAGDHLAASGAVKAKDLANMAYVALPDESESHI